MIGLVVVDHGSRVTEANQAFETFVYQLARQDIASVVEPAHMDLVEPSIRTAIGKCAQAGCSRIVVCPFFLAAGQHTQVDVPKLAGAASAEFGGLPYIVTQPVGLHPMMVEVVKASIASAP